MNSFDPDVLLEKCLSVKTSGSCTEQERLFDILKLTSLDEKETLPIYVGINVLKYAITYLQPNLDEDVCVQMVLDRFQMHMANIVRTLFFDIDLNVICNLSTEAYESEKVSNMTLTVLDEDQISKSGIVFYHIENKLKIEMTTVHLLRKLLNITKSSDKTQNNYCLILKSNCDSSFEIYGFADIKSISQKFPVVHFLKQAQWAVTLPSKKCDTLSIKERCIVQYNNGKFLLPLVDNSLWISKNLYDILKKLKISKPKKVTTLICSVISIAKKQRKGTGIIFLPTSFAEKEKERLTAANRAFQTSIPIGINKKSTLENIDLIFSQTAVDGVHIVDYTNFQCITFGTIVDGKCDIDVSSDDSPHGDIARGARYNSIETYIRNFPSTNLAFGVVISEDGFVNIITNQKNKHTLL